jgi:hypothetical protein
VSALPQAPLAAREPEARIIAAALGLAVLAGPLALLPARFGVVLVGALAVVALVAAVPVWGAYLLVGVTPFVAGIDRGAVIPVLRPSEALAGLVLAGLLARGAHALVTGAPLRVRPRALDLALVAFAVLGSIVPLLWMTARGKAISQDDALFALQLWKVVATYGIVRVAVRSEAEVARCLVIALGAAGVVAVVAILQALQLAGVPGLLVKLYAPNQDASEFAANRGSSTLASSLAVADFMVLSLAVATAWLIRLGRKRALLVPAAVLFLFGVLAAGQYSGFIALPVAVVALGLLLGRLRRFLAVSLALLPVAVLAMWPVIAHRLSGFQSVGGLPLSWRGRWENLTMYFWPQLGHFNWLLGVRPAARLPAPEAWRDYVWIESGHTWLLWTGGVPFFVAFFVLLGCGLKATARAARERLDAVGVAAAGGFTGLAVLAVLMLLDAHLTLRGSSDLLFTLLALALVRGR